MTKKLKAKRFLSVLTKNWNWEILTTNPLTFKRKDGVEDENFKYFGGLLKNPIFRCGEGGGDSWKTNVKRGITYKGGSFDSFPTYWGGAWQELLLNIMCNELRGM